MGGFEDLDALLAESDDDSEWYDSSYSNALPLASVLVETDLPALWGAWQARDERWRRRFVNVSGYMPQPMLRWLIEHTLEQPTEPLWTLSLAGYLPRQADKSALSESLIRFFVALWHTQPDLHEQIQMSAWNCGLSRRLLVRLGFDSWLEALR